jgi:type IV pilus assembly protein PilA
MFGQFCTRPLQVEGGKTLLCPTCGASIADNSQFCSNCGKSASQTQPTASLTPPTVPAAPIGPQQTSGKAIASLVCGIINVFPLFIAAIILGHISLSEIKKSGGRLKGEGVAIAGLVLGYLGIVAIPIILIIAAIAIPNLLRAKMAANEASAVVSIREIISAEVNYQNAHQDAGFTCNLSGLATLLTDSSLGTGQKNGYVFALQNCNSETAGGPTTKFQVTASPVSPNTSGQRAFCGDDSNVIRVDLAGSAESCLDHGSPLE